jgi:hypothetical protein
MKKKQILQIIVLSLMAAIYLCACGSSGSGDPVKNEDPPINQTTGKGTFGKYDGLIYYTQTKHGITSNGGKFDYVPGEEVGFYLNHDHLVFIGYATATDNMIISDLNLDGADNDDVSEQNIKSFLEAIDNDGNPVNGVTITESVREKATTPIDFSLASNMFIRINGSYAEYLADFASDATGDIGQTDATYNITLSKGIALYFPIYMGDGVILHPQKNSSEVINTDIKANPFITDGHTKEGAYIVGMNPGTITFRITQLCYPLEFNITVVPTDEYPEFNGTVFRYKKLPDYENNVPYSTFLASDLPEEIPEWLYVIRTALIFPESEGM